MVKQISTSKPKTLLDNLWRTSTPTQKKALLKALGLSTTWSKTKTIKEMVERGGGSIAKELLNLIKLRNKTIGKTQKVIFRK